MSPAHTSFVRRRFRGFTVHISATAISGTHDVRFNTGAGEFTLQMTQDEIDSVQSVFQQAHSLIDANLPGRCRSCAGTGEAATAGIGTVPADCPVCFGTGRDTQQVAA